MPVRLWSPRVSRQRLTRSHDRFLMPVSKLLPIEGLVVRE